MIAVADDYTWFRMLYPELARAYCLTLVRGPSPAQLLGRMGAREAPRQVSGVDALLRAAEPGFVAATRAGGWAFAIEPGGALGTTESVMRPLSVGTRVVAHSRDAVATGQFCWLENGSAALRFVPLFPDRQSGTEANGYLDLMREVGFGRYRNEEYDSATHAEAAFALAEALTGIRVTPGLLDETCYECAVIPKINLS